MELFARNATQKLICWNGIICKKCNPKTDLLEWNYLQEMHQKIDLLNGIIFMEWNKNSELSIHLDTSLFLGIHLKKLHITKISPFMNCPKKQPIHQQKQPATKDPVVGPSHGLNKICLKFSDNWWCLI
jgi:hypothetical protein